MATPILQVITQYCEGYCDDIRMESLRETNPALYLRQMWFFLRIAVSLFNIPAEMPRYLMGTEDDPKLIEPTFADAMYTLPVDEEGSIVIDLGEDYLGFELASCRQRSVEQDGRVEYYAVDFSYDAQTGEVTVNGTYPAGTVFEMDFASDGQFINTLTPEMMDILGTGFGLAWRERFNADWLSLVAKVEDKSFKEQTRSSDKRANTEQIEAMRVSFAGKMRRFSQNLYYKNFVPQGARININVVG